MIKIITVLGARPQFIKAAAVSRAIAAHNASSPDLIIQEVVVHTGQHYDPNMSEIFFSELAMKVPDYHLEVHGGSHGDMTGRMLIEIEKVLLAEKPDLVIVYGDTNSTLAGALAAVKLHIPVAHVEAGLRSFNMAMPEEVNRILTDRISRWLFTPTVVAAQHLVHEGAPAHHVIPVGDVMYDVALYEGAKVSSDGGILETLGLQNKSYILVTVHRAENTDHSERLTIIVDSLKEISKEISVVWPMHPRTKKILATMNIDVSALCVIEPVGYVEMVQLEKFASLIATDSGGVQKEAFFYSVPCVILRDETEWVELLEAGWNRLAPPVDLASVLSVLKTGLGSRGQSVQPYGNGDAATRIIDHLIAEFSS